MVVLKNIKMNKDTIEAEYYPENTNDKGFMKIRCTDGSIVEHDSAGYVGAPHVKRELIRLSSSKDVPKEKTVMWY